MNTLSDDSRRLMESLQSAVEEALERKRRLGQYAVVWRDGQPAFIGPNPPKPGQDYPAATSVRQGVTGVREPGHDEPSD